MDFEKVLNDRYSVRDFLSKEVEEEKINAILNASSKAPTGKNTQCQKIYVVKSEENLEKLRKAVPNVFNAPVVIITCGNKETECILKTGRSLMETDIAIINTYMMLETVNQGLGGCWVCNFYPEDVRKIFDIPENYEIFNLMPIGYLSKTVEPNPRHFDRLPLNETVKFL